MKKALMPDHMRSLISELFDRLRTNHRQLCQLSWLSRSSWYYKSIACDSSAASSKSPKRASIKVLGVCIYSWGVRDGLIITSACIGHIRKSDCHYDLNDQDVISPFNTDCPKTVESQNQLWSMDFVADNLFDGRKLRALTFVGQYCRERLKIHVGQRLTGEDFVQVMNQITFVGDCLKYIKTDDGSEFISKNLVKWAYEDQATMDFSRPGKHTNNAFIESRSLNP